MLWPVHIFCSPANDDRDSVANLNEVARASHATNVASYARAKEKLQSLNFARENTQDGREADSKLEDWLVMSEQSAAANDAWAKLLLDADADAMQQRSKELRGE